MTAGKCEVCWDRFNLQINVCEMIGCCGSTVCWKCLRRHILAIMEDAEAQRDMSCPACQNRRLTDVEVLEALRVGNWWGFFWAREQKEAKKYERWCVNYALRSIEPNLSVLRCPGLDCENLWLVDKRRRERKLRAEPRWIWSPVSRVFYSAPTLPTSSSADARRIYCNSCRRAFCALCRRPWRQIRKGHRGHGVQIGSGNVFVSDRNLAAPTESHDFKSCVSFAGRSIDVHDDFAAVASAADARHCPNCSLRVARTAGCNHIQCPSCAFHWCFICETKWSNSHYACRDEQGVTYKGGAFAAGQHLFFQQADNHQQQNNQLALLPPPAHNNNDHHTCLLQ
mmetsp:Transcript_2663/g.3448  ORF Transcript_2663/g.3448 Transcript_2663/m.3448 type:complete len:339 (-) Transcript_2663:1101-2117(-)